MELEKQGKKSNSKWIIIVIAILALVVLFYFAQQQLSIQVEQPETIVSGEVQTVKILVDGIDYIPSTVEVEKGKPVRLIVDGTKAEGCVQYFIIPKLKINTKLEPGENVFEFTPTEVGDIPFSCSMRMAMGKIVVKDSLGTTLTHEEMHEMQTTILGDHFEEKHHDALHTYIGEQGALNRKISHEDMHNFMTIWMGEHFEEKHHEVVHAYLVSKGVCDQEECPSGDVLTGETRLPGEGITTTKTAKSTTILSLNNGATVDFSADIVMKEINGKKYKMYGYNGQIPGPLFKVRQGSTITVKFKNNIDLNTTIHWHGLRHDIKDDGVPGVSQDPVKPGESFTYTVYFPDQGMYWYHPHIREDITQDAGLAGNMWVMPADDAYYNPVNTEEALVLDDLLIRNGEIVPYGKEHANFALMGRFGNVMLVNGETDYELQVKKGEVVRFFVTNVANTRPFNLSFSGAKMKLVGSDMGTYEKDTFVDSVIIAPAERYIVEVFFDKQGEYSIQNVNPHQTYDLGKVVVSEDVIEEDLSHIFNTAGENDITIKDIQQFKQYFRQAVDYTINLTVDMPSMEMAMIDHEEPETIEWEDTMATMNARSTTEEVTWILRDAKTGQENMDFSMNAKVGDKIKIRLFNDPDSMHPMQHPIHLHGQRFLVVSENGVLTKNLAWKETVLVPIGKTIDILVDVTNPGEWMMHCHIAEHLEAGMMTSLKVEV